MVFPPSPERTTIIRSILGFPCHCSLLQDIQRCERINREVQGQEWLLMIKTSRGDAIVNQYHEHVGFPLLSG